VSDGPRVHPQRLRDAGWLTILPLALNAVSLGANGFIIRQLGSDGYGTLVVAMGLAGATTILSNLGMRALYTKAVAGASPEDTERLLAEQLAVRSLLGLLAGGIAIAAALAFYPGDREILLCTVFQAIVVVATIGWTVLADILNARERFADNAKIALYSGLIVTAVTTLVAAAGGGAVGVGAAYVIGPIANFGLQLRTVRGLGVRIAVGGASWKRYRELLREARLLAANDLLSTIQSRAEGVWAPLLFGKSLIGVYDASTLPLSRLSQVSDGVATAYFPAMAVAHRDGDEATLRSQATQLMMFILAVAMPLAIFLWFGAPFIATLLFPSASQQSEATLCEFVLQVTAGAIPFGGLGVGMRYTLQAAGMHAQNAKDQMASTTVGAFLGIGLALGFGIRGLAAAVMMRAVLSRFLQGRTFARRFPGLMRQIPWTKLLLCLGTPIVIFLLGLGHYGQLGYFGAAILATIAAIGYLVSAMMAGILPRRTRPEGAR
jgi:O-antigen/teichoic acid export membrane protein